MIFPTWTKTDRRSRLGPALPAASLVTLVSFLAVAGVLGSVQDRKEEGAIVFGTVFTQRGFALPGATITARHVDDEKPKWKARTDARGEFSIHLPRASGKYEFTAEAKDFEPQTREIEIVGEEQRAILFRLNPKSKEDR